MDIDELLRRTTVYFSDLRPNDVIHTFANRADIKPVRFYLVVRNDRESIQLVDLADGHETLLGSRDYHLRDLRDFNLRLFNRKKDA